VLRGKCRRRRRAHRDNFTTRFEPMRKTPEIAASTIVKIAGSLCAAGVFVIHVIAELGSRRFNATHRDS
jgi:hypothetical protein